MFELLTLIQTAKSRLWGSQTATYTEFGQAKGIFTDLCGQTRQELELFMNDQNSYISEGVVLVDTSYDNDKTPRMPREVAAALRGEKISSQDRLKLAGTAVLSLADRSLDGQAGHSAAVAMDDSAPESVSQPVPSAPKSAATDRVALAQSHSNVNPLLDTSSASALLAALDSSPAVTPADPDPTQPPVTTRDGAALPEGAALARRDSDDDELLTKPYTTELEYLDDQFQLVTAQIKLSREKLKNDMREVLGENELQPWEREQRGKRTNIREFEAKVKLMKTRVELRLQATREHDASSVPRLMQLCERLQLGEFERAVVVLLIGNTVSPLMKEILSRFRDGELKSQSFSDAITVKLILHAFCTTFESQISHRRYFYRTSNLVKTGVVRMHMPLGAAAGGYDPDLTSQVVVLDRRMLDWIVGLDTEINEVVEGTHLYTPAVDMASVVLPAEQKNSILRSVTSFTQFREYQKRVRSEAPPDASETGGNGTVGLVFMFSGPSGTGKTLTVNAIATHLKKRVLLVDFNAMSEQIGKSKSDGAVQSLFREANMHDAIVFFDECEALFSQRGTGGSHQMSDLLIEIERHPGMM